MPESFIYSIAETNPDGCGTHAPEFVQFESKLTPEQIRTFQGILIDLNQESNNPLDTIENALKKFHKTNNIKGEITTQPFISQIYF